MYAIESKKQETEMRGYLSILVVVVICGTGALVCTSAPVLHAETYTPDAVFIAAKSVCKIEVRSRSGRSSSLGSGVLLECGIVLTVAHVAGKDRDVVCRFNHAEGQPRVTGRSVASATYDLSAIHLDEMPQSLRGVEVARNNPTVGDNVYHVGYPGSRKYALSKPSKVVGFLGSRDGSTDWVHSRAVYDSATPGDSGGPLFNQNGEVIGPTSSSDWPAQRKNSNSVSTGRTVEFLRWVNEKCGPAG